MSKEYCEKGDKCYEKGDYDGAIVNYVEALQINPNCAVLCYKLGCAWLKKGDIDEAIAYYEKSIFLEPNNTIVLYKRGILWKQKGKFDNAIADFDAVLRLDPNNQDAIINRAVALSLKSRKRISKIKKESEIAKKEQTEEEQNLSRSAQFRCEKCGLQLFITRPFTFHRYLNKFWCLRCYEQMKQDEDRIEGNR